MVRRGITQREQEILKMWEGGSTLEQIGKNYGVTRERIRQILKRLKNKGYSVLEKSERSTSRRNRNLDEVLAREKEILVRIGEGASVAAIAAEFGFMLKYTRLAVKQLFAAGKSIGAGYTPTDTTLAIWKIIQRKLASGSTLEQIADELSVSKRAIVRHIRLMREANLLPPSTRGPRPNEALQLRRESKVREMMARGLTRIEMASELGIGVATLARVLRHMRIRQGQIN